MSKLVALIEQRLGEKAPPEKPKLRVVEPPPKPEILFNDHERDWLRAQIYTLVRIYNLGWFLKQELFGHPSVELMPDLDLKTLYGRVERAVICIKEGVSFEDADLIRHDVEL